MIRHVCTNKVLYTREKTCKYTLEKKSNIRTKPLHNKTNTMIGPSNEEPAMDSSLIARRWVRP